MFKILKDWLFQFINLTINDSVYMYIKHISEVNNSINPCDNLSCAIDMI